MKEIWVKPIPPCGYVMKEGENPESKKAKLRQHEHFLKHLANVLEDRYFFYDDLPDKLREIAKDIIK